MNYTWRIAKLSLQDELNHEGVLHENAVVSVKWKRIAKDTDGTTASYVGNTAFSAKNVSEENFIPVNQLESSQVISWVENSITPAELQRIDDQLNKKIERNRSRNISPNW